jgi:lipopolysaccharide assembly outer membrane protein LptD (OstA)
MVRVFVFLWFACVCVVPPALAQQPAAQDSPSNDLIELFEAFGGKLEKDGDLMRFIEGADLPVPRHPGMRVFADEIVINRKTELLDAKGNVTFTGPDGHISADRIEFNIKDGTARFHHAAGYMSIPGSNRVEFGNQDPDVYFWGDLIEKLGPKKYVLSNGFFTTCVQPEPRWALGSKKITINLEEYVLARNMVLSVKGVPLLFLPAMYYPLHDEGRSTGILMPKYGASTFRGPSLSNAFFWAIGRSQDATFFHDWFTRTGTGMGSEYRYLSGVGSSGLFRFYRLNQHQAVYDQNNTTTTLPAQTTYQVDAAVSQSLGRRLRAQGNVEYFSDIATQQLYQQNTYARSSSRRMISGGVTGVYGPATVGGYYSRSEQFNDTHNSTVYGSTPRATGNIAPSKLFGSPVYASMSSEYVFQPNRRLQDGVVTSDESLARFDVAPALRVPLSRLTYLSVTTNAVYRQTYFSRSLDASGALVDAGISRQYLSLQTDVIGPVFSKIWDTPASGYSDRMKHVIEPTLSVEYLTEIANQARVPLSDSSVVAVGGAASFTYGLTNRLIARTRGLGEARGSTREFLTVGVQQTYYTDPKTSLFDTHYVSYSGRLKPIDFSPIAFTARISPTPVIDANARVEYDVTGNGLQILTAGTTITTAAGSSNVGFSRQRFTPLSDVSSYLTGSSSWRFAQGRVSAFYGLNWDIDAKYIYSQSLGGTYMSQCCGVQADFQIVNFLPSVGSPIPSDRRLNFSFVLAGLGTFSNFFGLFGGAP